MRTSSIAVDFKTATELDPTKAKYWFELGKHYEREEKNDAAIPALEKAAALDPQMVSAWFTLGTLASYRNEHERALLMWEKTLALAPKHADAHYNLGQHHQLRGDAKVSLTHFLASLESKPDNIETTKKIVQAYYRLEDYEKAGIYRRKMFDLIARSPDPTIRSTKEVCVDQFSVPGGRFFVYETISKDAPFFNWFTFKLVNEKGDVVKRINLEMDKAQDKPIMFLGQNEGKVHTNFGIGFALLPAYPALKALVLQAHDGKLKAAATTRFGE
jgi:tetratricopeptide (TPR) repeat protein